MPFGKKFGYISPIPNANSPYRTVSTVIIDQHYAQLLLIERWTWERYIRLAAFLKLTPYELASLVTMSHAEVGLLELNNRLKRDHANTLALVLTLLEHHVAGKFTADTIANPFPKLKRDA